MATKPKLQHVYTPRDLRPLVLAVRRNNLCQWKVIEAPRITHGRYSDLALSRFRLLASGAQHSRAQALVVARAAAEAELARRENLAPENVALAREEAELVSDLSATPSLE